LVERKGWYSLVFIVSLSVCTNFSSESGSHKQYYPVFHLASLHIFIYNPAIVA
jgi:hypothetical protein